MLKELEELNRTPFVKQRDGSWALFMLEGKKLEYGSRFDVGVGYRFYFKYEGHKTINIFTLDDMQKTAVKLRLREQNQQIVELANDILKHVANIEKINTAWKLQGSPPHPIEQEVAGHA